MEKSITIPIGGNKFLILSGEFPIMEYEWELLQQILIAMKPGLVHCEDEALIELAKESTNEPERDFFEAMKE